MKRPCFSAETLTFLRSATRRKDPEWLMKDRDAYDRAIVLPLQELARTLKKQLGQDAAHYHFPLRGIGRLKRSSIKASEHGTLYKNWLSYTASRPAESRFEKNPSLFFMINPEDRDDPVLLAGGLYMPSSRQIRAIREAIAAEDSPFAQELDRLFRSKSFKRRFPEGFSQERQSRRMPRGFPLEHPRGDWLRLQGYFVWRSYPLALFKTPKFHDQLVRDAREILKLNALLDQATQGRSFASASERKKGSDLDSRLGEISAPLRPMDF